MATSMYSLEKGSDNLDEHCDICLHQNKTSTAVSYCEICQEALCSVCHNVHENQRLTREHKLLTGDKLFAFFTSKRLSASFGKIEGKGGPNFETSIVDMTMTDIKHHNVGCERVQSVVFMPSGHVVLACGNGGLKLLDKDFKHIGQLSLFSVCASGVSDTEVLVSRGSKKKIQFVDVLPNMTAKDAVDIGKVTNEVCYHNGEIYVACEDSPGTGEVLVVNRRGQLLGKLGFYDKTFMFTVPWDVKVNNKGDKVFVTDGGTHAVTCMDMAGRVVYRYTDTDLKGPSGILVDRHDNVLVTAVGSHNVHAISRDGRKHKVILSVEDGIQNPYCISLRYDDGCLAVGTGKKDNLSLVTMGIK